MRQDFLLSLCYHSLQKCISRHATLSGHIMTIQKSFYCLIMAAQWKTSLFDGRSSKRSSTIESITLTISPLSFIIRALVSVNISRSLQKLYPYSGAQEPGRKCGAANFCGVRVAHLFCVVLCLRVLFVFILCLVCPVLPMSLECSFLVAPSVFSNVAPFPLFCFSYIACLSYFPVHFENPSFSGKLLQLYSYFPVHPCTSDTEVLPANRVFV